MADQRLITLYPGQTPSTDIVLRPLPNADVVTTTIYLWAGEASPKDIVLRDPMAAPAGGAITATLSAAQSADSLSASGALAIGATLNTTQASNTISGSGQLSIGAALSTTQGADTLSATGTLAALPGGSTLDRILAILMGRKVYDSTTGLWRVYDPYGVELADPSGILLQGLHGWLLRQATMLASAPAAAEGIGGGGERYRRLNPRIRSRKEIDAEREEIGIIQRELEVVEAARKAAEPPPKEATGDYWSWHLHAALLEQQLAELAASDAIRRASESAQLADIKAALARQEAIRLVLRRQRLIDLDMAFMIVMLSEV